MKKLIFLCSLIAVSTITIAQTGIIYNIAFRIDQELVTQTKLQNKDFKIINLATIEEMPKELSDTIAIISEQIIGEHLQVTLIRTPYEEKLISGALPEHLLYLPAANLNKAVKANPTNKYFVTIQCHVAANGGAKITIGTNSYSKVKPKVSLTIQVYNQNKELFEKKTVTIKDFEKLRSHSFEKTYGIRGLIQNTEDVTVSETLDSNDILKMFVMALEQIYK